MKRYIAITSALVLCGCAVDQIGDGLSALRGQHVDTLIAQIGLPDDQRQIAGRTVYIWTNQTRGAVPVTTPQTAYGYVGAAPVSMTYNQTRMMDVSGDCRISVAVDNQQIIRSYTVRGNEYGCGAYSGPLSAFAREGRSRRNVEADAAITSATAQTGKPAALD